MGCFNKTGFFSHLPITYGDEIVMFVCADSYSRSCTRDNTPISVVGTGMHNQDVCYETVIPIFEEIMDTLKRKAKKYIEE